MIKDGWKDGRTDYKNGWLEKRKKVDGWINENSRTMDYKTGWMGGCTNQKSRWMDGCTNETN